MDRRPGLAALRPTTPPCANNGAGAPWSRPALTRSGGLRVICGFTPIAGGSATGKVSPEPAER
jgi:hypothetical protein